MTLLVAPVVAPPAPVGTDRLFAAGGADLARHLVAFGPLPSEVSLAELERSGLDGRGGAGFPVWRKLAAVEPGRRGAAVVIANGAEGEPLSAKDATLLRRAPHLVIDGLLLAARAIGARDMLLYSGARQLDAVRRAIGERTDAAGIELREAMDTFISGEASAVVNGIEHGRPVPLDRVRRLTDSGLRGRPTLVQNVETLAHLALIARFGAAWFRSVGTVDEPGTRLLTVTMGARSGVVEAPGGIRLSEAIARAGFAPAEAASVLVGGYHGAWVPAEAIGTPLSRAGLAGFGASPGAGIILVLERGTCPVGVAAGIAEYLAAQSARQCGPCVNGLPRMAETLRAVAAGERAAVPEARRLSALVTGRGSCHHPDGTARFVLSTLTVFADEIDRHLAGRCTEGERHHG